MRVYDRNLTGASAAESGRAQETQRTDRNEGSGARSAAGAGAGDRVELSGTLARLSQAMSAHGSERAARVQSLTAQYRSGSYRPDSQATSRAMISEALTAGGK